LLVFLGQIVHAAVVAGVLDYVSEARATAWVAGSLALALPRGRQLDSKKLGCPPLWARFSSGGRWPSGALVCSAKSRLRAGPHDLRGHTSWIAAQIDQRPGPHRGAISSWPSTKYASIGLMRAEPSRRNPAELADSRFATPSPAGQAAALSPPSRTSNPSGHRSPFDRTRLPKPRRDTPKRAGPPRTARGSVDERAVASGGRAHVPR
jgi:hypothetical protein